MKKTTLLITFSSLIISSCVSTKTHNELIKEHESTKKKLKISKLKQKEDQKKISQIEDRIAGYNQKIFSLANENSSLTIENANSISSLKSGFPLSNEAKKQLNNTLTSMDPKVVAGAKNLKDSVNLALNYKLSNTGEFTGDTNINIGETVVKINVSDKLLFQTGSININSRAFPLLSKLADIIKTEPSIDIMIEGHTDSRPINNAENKDNWDLSVRRATSITRILQNKYGVNPSQLIASGRSSYKPLVDNTNTENRARNRRTQIIILPNMDKFLALLENPYSKQ